MNNYRSFFLAALAGLLLMIVNQANGQYCSISTTYTSGYITNVTFNTINNTTTTPTSGGYNDFTNISTTLVPGNTYSITVTAQTYPQGTQVGIWIDWEQDYNFLNSAPIIVSGNNTLGPFTANITVPSNATPGSTRMRVLLDCWGSFQIGPCLSPPDGEIEDYTINIPAGAAVDAGISSLDGIIQPSAPGIQNIKASLKNFGSAALTSTTINWDVNGLVQTPFSWTGNLASLATDSAIIIGSYNFPAGTHNLKAWSSLPNAVVDTFPGNDTSEILMYVCNPFSGVYTIGGASADFPDVVTAINAVSVCGVSGPTTFSINPGTYPGAIILNEIPGASAVNTITLQSSSGNPTDVIILAAANNIANNYTIKLDGGDFWRIKNLNIKADDALFSNVIVFDNGAHNNLLEGNILASNPLSATSPYAAVIYSGNGSTDTANVIMNNEINNANYGIQWYGSTQNYAKGNIIQDNIIQDFYYAGLTFYYQDDLIISGNSLETATSSGNNRGIYLTNCNNMLDVSNNSIILHGNGSLYGISLFSCTASGAFTGLVANNYVVQTSPTTGIAYGIHNNNSSHKNYYHNSISFSSSNSSARCAYFQSGTMASIEVVNNIFYHNGGGYSLYVTTNGASSITYIDYNAFYSSGNNLAYWNANCSNLSMLQSNSGQNYNSLEIDPMFYGPVSPYPANPALDNMGTFVGVTTDIDGILRNPVTPDIGAVEFTITPHDAGVVSIDSPVSPVPSGLQPVSVSFRNYGTSNLTSVTLNFSVNGGGVYSYNWYGNIAQDSVVGPVALPFYNFAAGSHEIKAWTSNPNGVPDSNNVNDTMTTIVNVCQLLSGTYTIGDTLADYPDFTAAVNAMTACGISGNIVFNVKPGDYNEQLIVPEINGASLSSRVTFQSSTGIASDVVLHYASFSNTTDFVILLDGADYIDIKNMTIRLDSAFFGRTIKLDNESNFNLIHGNIIESWPSASLSFSAIYLKNAVNSYNYITNNTIRYGYHGIYIRGKSSALHASGNIINGNSISGYYKYGVYSQYQDGVSINDNSITNASSSGAPYGIYCNNNNDGFQVSRNKIHLTGLTDNYGIYSSNCNGSDATGLFSNNMIAHTSPSSNIVKGIYSYNCSKINYYHNSVNIMGGSNPEGICIHVNGTNTDSVEFINNIAVNTGGGYAAYIPPNVLQGISAMDYNDWYVTGSYLARVGPNLTDLASFQNITGMDSNSASLSPGFASGTDLTPTSASLDNLGFPITIVPDDINGTQRSLVTPDIGCVEYSAPAIDMKVLAWVSPSPMACGLNSATPIIIDLYNNGTALITGFTITYSIDNGFSWTNPENVSNSLNPGDTLTHSFNVLANMSGNGPYHCIAAVTATGDAIQSNDTIRTTVSNVDVITSLPFYEDFETGNNYLGLSHGLHADIEVNNNSGNPGNAIHMTGSPSGAGWNGTSVNTNAIQAWYQNTGFHSNAATCQVDASNLNALHLTFDLKMNYSFGSDFSWFRVLVNDTGQISDIYGETNFKPQTSTADPFRKLEFDLTPYINAPFTITFQFAGKYEYKYYHDGDNAFVDNIRIFEPAQNDVGVSAIMHPLDSACANPLSDVVVGVRNYGYNSQDNFPVYARITFPNQTSQTLTATFTDTLLPNQVMLFNVGQVNASAVGTYTIESWTRLTGDQLTGNDTSLASFHTISPINTFPFTEDFETFIPGAPGVLKNAWTAIPESGFRMEVNSGPTSSNNTGPDFDHTTGTNSGIYVYSEANNGSFGDDAMLISPCLNLNSLNVPQLRFWYHMFGQNIHELAVDVLQGGIWITNIHSITGQQQSSSSAPWLQAIVDLSNYKAADKIRFRITRGTNYLGDVAIDDILIQETPPLEAELYMISAPTGGCNLGMESVEIKIVNKGSSTISNNLLAGYQLLGGNVVSENVLDSIPSGDTLIFIFGTPVDLSVTNDHTFELTSWISLAGDPYPADDTSGTSIHSKASPPPPSVTNINISSGNSATLNIINPDTGQEYSWYDDAVATSPLGTGISYQTPSLQITTVYWVEGKYIGTGCTSTRVPDTVFVSSQVLSVNAGMDKSICEGDTTSLTAMASGGVQPYTYAWSPGGSLSNAGISNPQAFPLSNTTYSVTITDLNGDSGSDDVIILVDPAPNVSLSLPFDTVCYYSGLISLSGGLPAGGVYSGAGVSGGYFNPMAVGIGYKTISYTYTEVSTNCAASAMDTFEVTPCTGIEDIRDEIGIKLYPNPSSDFVTLSITGIKESLDLHILNIEGKVVSSRKLPFEGADAEYKLDFSHYPAGIYYIRLSGKTTQKVTRVVVEK